MNKKIKKIEYILIKGVFLLLIIQLYFVSEKVARQKEYIELQRSCIGKGSQIVNGVCIREPFNETRIEECDVKGYLSLCYKIKTSVAGNPIILNPRTIYEEYQPSYVEYPEKVVSIFDENKLKEGLYCGTNLSEELFGLKKEVCLDGFYIGDKFYSPKYKYGEIKYVKGRW